MISINFKKKFLISAVVISAMFLTVNKISAKVGPMTILNQAKKTENRANKITSFCNRLSTLKANLQQKIANRKNKSLTNQTNRLDKLKKKQDDIDFKITEGRKQRDANLTQNFQILEKRAQTAEQKDAVKKFETVMLNAIQARRTAVDEARNTFREAVKGLIQERKTKIEEIVSNLQSSKEAAFNKAQSLCAENNNDENSVQATLKSDLSEAVKNQFANKPQEVKKIGTQIATLAQTRRQALKTAQDTFHLAVQKAVADLKSSFSQGKNSADSSDENNDTVNSVSPSVSINSSDSGAKNIQ